MIWSDASAHTTAVRSWRRLEAGIPVPDKRGCAAGWSIRSASLSRGRMVRCSAVRDIAFISFADGSVGLSCRGPWQFGLESVCKTTRCCVELAGRRLEPRSFWWV